LHHAVVLEPVLDEVGMVWVGLLKKPLDVVYRWPHQASIAVHGGRDLSHVKAAHLLAVVVTTAGHGRGP
jgi:hypothetical protein